MQCIGAFTIFIKQTFNMSTWEFHVIGLTLLGREEWAVPWSFFRLAFWGDWRFDLVSLRLINLMGWTLRTFLPIIEWKKKKLVSLQEDSFKTNIEAGKAMKALKPWFVNWLESYLQKPSSYFQKPRSKIQIMPLREKKQ